MKNIFHIAMNIVSKIGFENYIHVTSKSKNKQYLFPLSFSETNIKNAYPIDLCRSILVHEWNIIFLVADVNEYSQLFFFQFIFL